MKDSELLSDLYDGKKYLVVRFTNNMYPYHVVLHGRDKTPDCYITSFQANLYFRTEKGTNRTKYSTYNRMLNEVQRRAFKILGKERGTIESVEIREVTEKDSLPVLKLYSINHV